MVLAVSGLGDGRGGMSAFKLFIANWCVEEIENILFIVAFKLFIDNIELVDNELTFVNIVVDVAFKLFIANWCVEEIENILFIVEFKLFIDNIELVDNELRLVNIVVDVVLMFGMSKYDCVDKLFKLVNIVLDVEFKLFIFVLISLNIIFGFVMDVYETDETFNIFSCVDVSFWKLIILFI